MPPRPSFSSMWTNARPPRPAFKVENIPDLEGKVYIVSGSSAGVGKEVARALYSKNARVYIAARSQEKSNIAMEEIKSSVPSSTGSLGYIKLDLADLSTIKTSAENFLKQETQLNVLFNNAGTVSLDLDAKSAQGHEIHLGVNCLGTFLFSHYLTPILKSTAQAEISGSTRVVWVSSSAAEMMSHEDVAISREYLADPTTEGSAMNRYGLSKAGNWLHSVEYARRFKEDGIVSVALNPGNLDSDLFREASVVAKVAWRCISYAPINGAYTELYAGLAPDITLEQTGAWIIPWGRVGSIRGDLEKATKPEEEGGNGSAQYFWEWSESQLEEYL